MATNTATPRTIPASVKAHRSKCLRRYGQLKSRKSIIVFDSPRSLSCTISCCASLANGIAEKDGLPPRSAMNHPFLGGTVAPLLLCEKGNSVHYIDTILGSLL